MKRITGVALVVLAANALADQQVSITGQIQDESGRPLSGVNVVIGDSNVTSDNKGRFTFATVKQPSYSLSLEKPGFYQSIQHFSDHELSRLQDKAYDIHPIALVKKAKNRVLLSFTGDAMMGRRYYKPYFGDEVLIREGSRLKDSKALLAAVKPYLSAADYAVVNLETQIADTEPGQRAKKSVTFFSRPETLSALSWAGVDYVSLGNNHTYDYLDEGLEATLKYLNESGLGYSGAGVTESDALKPYRTTINGVPLSMLGYVGWTGRSKPYQTATSEQGGAAWGSMANILSSVGKEVQKRQVPIVQYHGSQEYSEGPTGTTEQRLKSALDAGAALAIAHHPHVAQGLELYDGKLLAYSLGNFVFDQNFSATQHSFLLNVWLDGEQFHRAELVPIYVKGYKPTPATGNHRYTIMRRLSELSKARDTHIGRSGGHGVISKDNQTQKTTQQFSISIPQGERSTSLYHLPWHKTVKQVTQPEGHQYRLGINLVNGGDFESFDTFGATERGWLFERSSTALSNTGYNSQKSLSLALIPNKSQWFGMQSFRRVYMPDQPTTVKFRIKTPGKTQVKLYWQGRKTRQKLFDAFENGEKHLLSAQTLSAKDDWQTIEVDFDSPRIGYRSYRVLLSLENLDGSESKVNIDDFALIEWQGAFSKAATARPVAKSTRASFIGLDKPSSKRFTLELE